VKNVLMISYFAPPLNLPPAIRIGKFAKFLPEFGWNPIILTVKEIDFYQNDEELFKDIPNLNTMRTETIDYFRIMTLFRKTKNDEISKNLHKSNERLTNFIKSIFPIDDKIGWMPFCYNAAKKIMKTNRIDAIYVSMGGIFHTAITAYLLAKKYDLPLFLEFRDLWADHPFINHGFINRILNNYWERKIVGFAKKTIVVTEGMKDHLQKKYEMNEKKFEVITNGFDEADFTFLTPAKKKENTLIFTFCGSFYKELSPIDLYESLLKIQNGKQQIKIRFIGDFRNYFYELLEEYEGKLKDKNIIIEVIPRLKYQELIQKLNESDLLLIFLPDDKKYNMILTAKIFDYLPLKIPVMGFCPESSDVYKMIKSGNLGFSIIPGDYNQGKKVIEEIIYQWKEDKLKKNHGNDELIKRFTRRNLSKRFAKVLDSIT